MTSPLFIGLSAVLVAIENGDTAVLTTRRGDAVHALPFGPFDPDAHRTFDLSLRGWVREQTGFELGYVEQLYTFGDKDRETPEATLANAPADARVISVGYLALTPLAQQPDLTFEADWRSWYTFFPWEDHRSGRPSMIDDAIAPRLATWSVGNESRMKRADRAFGLNNEPWVEERVLERYELLYEAGLVAECARDVGLPEPGIHLGEAMASDHRRILATAIARLRGKIKYRPVIFQLLPGAFTLSTLQRTAEAILGLELHTQNFRRALEKSGIVRGTGDMQSATGGRPAELYAFQKDVAQSRAQSGLTIPRKSTDT
jgi:hypothetical protein